MKIETIEPKFVMINFIDGGVNFYPLDNFFSFFRGKNADFMIRIQKDIGLLAIHEEYELSEDEFYRLIKFFEFLSIPRMTYKKEGDEDEENYTLDKNQEDQDRR
jgi:hypothetical protein